MHRLSHRKGVLHDGSHQAPHPLRLHGAAGPNGLTAAGDPPHSTQTDRNGSALFQGFAPQKRLPPHLRRAGQQPAISIAKEHHYGSHQAPNPLRLHGAAAQGAGPLRPDDRHPPGELPPLRLHPPGHPRIEASEVLLAKGGGETEKQIYRFTKGDSDLSLRFDLTVPLAKYVALHYNELSFPFRRFQIGKVYRGERAQRGTLR